MVKTIIISCLFLISAASISAADVLKTQYVVDYAPLSFEISGKTAGIYSDIVTELNDRLRNKNIRIVSESPEFVPIKRILKNLKKGEIDMIVSMTRTQAREKIFQYASTLMLRPEMTFAKLISDNSEYPDNASLKGKTICSLGGSNSAKNISGIEGIAGMDNAYDISTCLKMLAAERVDIVYFHHFALLYYLKELKLGDRIRLVKKPLKIKKYYMCFSKKVNPDTITEIDKATASMIQDGMLKSILDRYR